MSRPRPSRPLRTRQVPYRLPELISIRLHSARIVLLMSTFLRVLIGLSCVELMAADFQALKVYAGSAQHSLARRFLGNKGKFEQQSRQPQEQQKEQQQILQAPTFPPPSYPPGF